MVNAGNNIHLAEVNRRLTFYIVTQECLSMDKTYEAITKIINATSPQTQHLLSIGFTVFALYFSVSFGESLGKAFYYLNH